MSNTQGYFVIAALLVLIVGGGVAWYMYDNAHRIPEVPTADLVPNKIPEEEVKTITPAAYLRSSTAHNGDTTLAWSSAPGATACKILKFTSRPQGAEPTETTAVEAEGTLAVKAGAYYRLTCKGGNTTIQSDIDLLTL